MDLYRRGDGLSASAFEELYRRYGGRIFMFLSKRVAGAGVAEDLTQEVFFKLHRSKHLYHSTLPFSPWLFSVARSVLLDHLKRKTVESPVGGSTELDTLSQQADLISTHLPEPSAALARLPDAQSEAVRLRVYESETFDEIAERLSTSPENARQLFSRGIKKLRSIFKTREDL